MKPATGDGEDHSRMRALVRVIDRKLDDDGRVALLGWAKSLLALREARLPSRRKAAKALKLTETKAVVSALAKVGGPLKDVAWDDRSWAMRLGLSAAAIGAATTAGQGAGIALLGTAIGVPLWVVFGAGASFAGMLIDELETTIERRRAGRLDEVGPPVEDPLEELPEAEWELEAVLPSEPAPPALPAAARAARHELEELSRRLSESDQESHGILTKGLSALRKLGRRRRFPWVRRGR